jgi:hypothetical protein
MFDVVTCGGFFIAGVAVGYAVCMVLAWKDMKNEMEQVQESYNDGRDLNASCDDCIHVYVVPKDFDSPHRIVTGTTGRTHSESV